MFRAPAPTASRGRRSTLAALVARRSRLLVAASAWLALGCGGSSGSSDATSDTTADTLVEVTTTGCSDRVLQCGAHEWCCGEAGSPYESTASCGDIGDDQAQPGQCFPIAEPDPFCVRCEADATVCDSGALGWEHGLNQDPAVDGGAPFREEEECYTIEQDLSGAVTKALCGVTCNSSGADTGCPRLWQCQPRWYLCFDDADCGGQLTCVGADSDAAPPRPGRCQCGPGAVPCPDQRLTGFDAGTPSYGPVERPRCVDDGGTSFCLATWNCTPPPFSAGYPSACTQ